MISLSSQAFWSIFTFCPFASALALNLYNVTSPGLVSQNSSDLTVGVNPNIHCTKDANFLTPAFPDIRFYDFMCQAALAKAGEELASHGLDTEFEFLDRGVTAQTTRPQIQLPRKYVAKPRTGQGHLPPCTIAIAMIDSLGPGDPLPEEPPGPFVSSDVMTMRELIYNPGLLGRPFTQCLRHFSDPQTPDPSLAWSQAGRSGNIGIFYMGTRSVIDRRILRALHPSLVEEE